MTKLVGLVISFAVLFMPLCSVAMAKSQLVIHWDGIRIRTEEADFVKVRSPSQFAGSPIVDCVFNAMKTKCWKLKRTKKSGESYGHNLKFVQPVAVLPNFERIEPTAEQISEAYQQAGNAAFVSSLKQFELRKIPQQAIDSAPDDVAIIGQDSQDWTFSATSETLGGEYALGVWKFLIGKLPKRDCVGGEVCNVVTRATRNGNEAIARCDIENSKFGLGIPHSCETVAFIRNGIWFVYSYAGPQQCDGCGAGAGTECMLESSLPLSHIASAVIDALQVGRTNIALKPLTESAESIKLVGRNIGTPSKFYAGYYDRSYATYTISRSGSDSNQVTIFGLFNLLISVEQSGKGKDYRDIGNGKDQSDLDWFQNQILDVIKNGLAKKLKVKLSCDSMAL
jgi:hypothetical protein